MRIAAERVAAVGTGGSPVKFGFVIRKIAGRGISPAGFFSPDFPRGGRRKRISPVPDGEKMFFFPHPNLIFHPDMVY